MVLKMKTSKGRGKVLISGINNKQHVVVLDGSYTEDGRYFIYKTHLYWYLMDTKSGLSLGKGDNYTTKTGLLQNFNKLTSEFEDRVKKYDVVYKKIATKYKRLCKEYDLKKENK